MANDGPDKRKVTLENTVGVRRPYRDLIISKQMNEMMNVTETITGVIQCCMAI